MDGVGGVDREEGGGAGEEDEDGGGVAGGDSEEWDQSSEVVRRCIKSCAPLVMACGFWLRVPAR